MKQSCCFDIFSKSSLPKNFLTMCFSKGRASFWERFLVCRKLNWSLEYSFYFLYFSEFLSVNDGIIYLSFILFFCGMVFLKWMHRYSKRHITFSMRSHQLQHYWLNFEVKCFRWYKSEQLLAWSKALVLINFISSCRFSVKRFPERAAYFPFPSVWGFQVLPFLLSIEKSI